MSNAPLVWSCAPLVSLCACASVAGAPRDPDPRSGEAELAARYDATAQAPERARRRIHDVTLMVESYEPDTLDVELDGDKVGELDDVERTLTHLRYRVGPQAGGFFVGLVSEEFESAAFGADDSAELVGIELGGDGFVRLAREGGAAPAIDWGVGLEIVGGQLDATDDDVAEADFALRLGVGVDLWDFDLSGGFHSRTTARAIDDAADTVFVGSNAGAYLRAAYRPDELPITGSVMLTFGDLEGAALGFGLHL